MTETEPRRRVLMAASVLTGMVMLSAAAILGFGELGGASLSPVSLPDGGGRPPAPVTAAATRVSTASAPVTRPAHHGPAPTALPSPRLTRTARPTVTRPPRTARVTPAPRRHTTTAPPVTPGEASVTPARSRRPAAVTPTPAPTLPEVTADTSANPAGHTPPGHTRRPGNGNDNGHAEH
ncbi:hypothetical protein HTZ77_22290 [Nonomuraea sp. SMC257]|uniref:Uncharacterized protein n=1 Tax=Nonomuraea montanisoli TaxID=2741721 RepID=A0A7Y6M5C9_9ACTN|nr:hypothetical protein [Nonomuraea montanisoli]NUW34144.1 hypothetical protein [Nonomuraea montanisoli]